MSHPWAGRDGRGTRRRISTPGRRSPLPAPPFPGLAGGGRDGEGGRFVFVLVRGFSAGGGGALRRHPLQLGSSRRGAGHAGSGSAAAGAGPGGVGGTRPRLNYDSRHAPRRRGYAASAHCAPRRRRALRRPPGTCRLLTSRERRDRHPARRLLRGDGASPATAAIVHRAARSGVPRCGAASCLSRQLPLNAWLHPSLDVAP